MQLLPCCLQKNLDFLPSRKDNKSFSTTTIERQFTLTVAHDKTILNYTPNKQKVFVLILTNSKVVSISAFEVPVLQTGCLQIEYIVISMIDT